MGDFKIKFLTDKNIARHNHPIWYVDELEETLKALKSHNFTDDQGALFFGEFTKSLSFS